MKGLYIRERREAVEREREGSGREGGGVIGRRFNGTYECYPHCQVPVGSPGKKGGEGGSRKGENARYESGV